MKFLVLLVFCYGVKANVFQTGTESQLRHPIANECGVESMIYDNEELVTDENNLIEPCDKTDYDCMRDYLAQNSNCEPVDGRIADPLYLSQSTFYLPNCNITISYTQYTMSGLNNATIQAFYYDKKTKNLVISINMPSVTVYIPRYIFTYRRPGQDSIVKSDVAIVYYKSLTYTITIPKDKKLRMNRADGRFVCTNVGNPEFTIGPGAYTSDDPFVKAGYACLVADVPLAVREIWLFHSQLIATLYIQKFMCDFGLDLYTV